MADKRRQQRAKRDTKRATAGKHTVMEVRGRQAELLTASRNGTLDVSDWDLEELLRGYRRSKNGRFSGRPPSIVPREVHQELAKRVRNDVAHALRGIAHKHIEPVFKAILAAQASGIPPEQVPAMRLQLQAAQDLMDRFVVGRQEKIEVSGTMKHEAIIQDVTIDRTFDEDDDADIVDAEIIDEELDEWDD